MRDFDDSTLWRISAFERQRETTGDSGFVRLDATTVLPASLGAEMAQLRRLHRATDVVEVLAACIRQRDNALLLLRHNELVWPLTIFPAREFYHVPRDIIGALNSGGRDLQVIAVEAPGMRLPAMPALATDATAAGFRPLAPLLWAVALQAPRVLLLDDIAGRAAYRINAKFSGEAARPTGAIGATLVRLRGQIASLQEIAGWPGMDRERAARLLNAVYLQGGLMVLRSHAAARGDGQGKSLVNWWRGRG